MGKEGPVYWAELQSELTSAGLDISVNIPTPGLPWSGLLEGKPFILSVTPKNSKDGLRDTLLFTFSGQDEAKNVPLLTKFMGYEPSLKYQVKTHGEGFITYEWTKTPEQIFTQVSEDPNYINVQQLKSAEQSTASQSEALVQRYYQEFTPDVIVAWEEAASKNPDETWNENNIKKLLPFIKKVPSLRIARNQSLFGLSIISLDSKFENEGEIVRLGLEPLLAAKIIEPTAVEDILMWYKRTDPTWDSGGTGHIRFQFQIDGIQYSLQTDSYRNCRDLNLVC